MSQPLPLAVLERLRNLVRPPVEKNSDGDLLRRFVHAGDEDAFATLLQRHGPLVLGLCRRLLRQQLTRRGLTPAATGLAALPAGAALARAVPVALGNATVRGAVLFLAGSQAALDWAGSACAIAEGVLSDFEGSRIKLVGALLV